MGKKLVFKECKVCNGIGILSSSGRPCSACGGRGFLILEESNAEESRVEIFAKTLLRRIRDFVDSEKMNIERLPKWIKSAKVKIAHLNNSNIILYEAAYSNKDEYVHYGEVKTDLQFFLGLPEYTPIGASFKAPRTENKALIILHGEYAEGKQVIFDITTPNSALFNVGYLAYHSPIAILNIFMQLSLSGNVLAIRFVPFAVYIHDNDITHFPEIWDKSASYIKSSLLSIHESEGDYYESVRIEKNAFLIRKEKSVIVFGKDSVPDTLAELEQVRDYLKGKGYDAYLLRELPEHPAMSIEQKVKLWSLASRFCVMIDRQPSGHLVEYPYLESVGAILALLRPKKGGSTYMIGDSRVKGIRHIETFHFDETPFEVMEKVIDWAESLVQEQIKGYEKVYPWRKEKR
ncbi:zinc finger-like domain-containing protein [Candidatus Bathyarchaeota archaeon]|nr:zinc finger-like domain-containing protein [Candidatus Bathyarchaeota archaeon]